MEFGQYGKRPLALVLIKKRRVEPVLKKCGMKECNPAVQPMTAGSKRNHEGALLLPGGK
jgi:hypothetical protein